MQSLLFILHNNYYKALAILYSRNIYHFSRFIYYSKYPYIKKRLCFTTKQFKKSKKENYKKCRCNVIKRVYLKPKDLEKKKQQSKKMNFFL